MRIIINADDFGFDSDSTRATIECFNNGGLTSATIMARMSSTAEAIAFARAHPEFSFGCHLTFSSDGPERPVLSPSTIPGLVDGDGRFLGPIAVRSRAIRNALPIEQIEREMEAQLGLLRDAGLSLSHVDSHGHLHKYRPFRQALERTLPRFGISRVRIAQNVYLRPPLRSFSYWLGGLWGRAIRRRFVTTDHFFMPTTAGDTDWTDSLLRREFRGATLEVGVHPGYEEKWRDQERLACPEFARAAASAGHTLIGWGQL